MHCKPSLPASKRRKALSGDHTYSLLDTTEQTSYPKPSIEATLSKSHTPTIVEEIRENHNSLFREMLHLYNPATTFSHRK